MSNWNIKEVKQGFTHGGVFHADDVFATALLQILNPQLEVIRGNKIPDDFSGIIYDIGCGEFDHHQKEKFIRENDVPYAAFGLLWKQFGTSLLGEEDVRFFDETFVLPLDLSDNGGGANQVSEIISDMNAEWGSSEAERKMAFERAVTFAKTILENRFRRLRGNRAAMEYIHAQTVNCTEQILYLEKGMSWKEGVKGTELLYVIFPSLRGGWNIQAVPEDWDEFLPKKPFPKDWCARTPEELEQLTGIKGFEFCHANGFLAFARTAEAAWQIARLAREK